MIVVGKGLTETYDQWILQASLSWAGKRKSCSVLMLKMKKELFARRGF